MKRKMPVRTATLDFAEDGYPDFHCETWTNIPIAYTRRYSALNASSDTAEADSLFLRMFPSWDFADLEGKVIPHTAKGLLLIPGELGAAMMKRRAEALQNGAMPGPLEPESSGPPSDEPKG